MDMITKVYSYIEFEQLYEAMNQTHERRNNIISVRGKLGYRRENETDK